MSLVKVVSVVVAATCLLSACQSASVPEAEIAPRTERLGILNRYYLMTWERAENRLDMELVENSATGIEALTLTGTENVACIVHGRESGAFSEFGYTLVSSLIKKDNMAVFVLDWSFISSLPYEQAALLISSVAEDLIAFIAQLETSGKLNRDLLHFIGFDLGAHIVGIASRDSTARARKITALSPAGMDAFAQRLRATDAQFVETIHTDAVGVRAFGVAEAIGGLDFYPNGGTRQPGCANSDNWCHHNRAWQLFAATVDNDGHLTGQRCETRTQVNNNRCVGPPEVLGSLQLVKWSVGLYRVNTGRAYPYSP